MTPDRRTIRAARKDPGLFAEVLVGERLWDHQLEVVRSDAHIRAVCSGRQAGKSRSLAVLAIHQGFTAPGSLTLLVSAGEQASRDLLAHISALVAQAQWLGGSVVDDNRSTVTLSNRSEIRSVPASARQIRGLAVDLLVMDEAAFIDRRSGVRLDTGSSLAAAPASSPAPRPLASSTAGSPPRGGPAWHRAGWRTTRVFIGRRRSTRWSIKPSLRSGARRPVIASTAARCSPSGSTT